MTNIKFVEVWEQASSLDEVSAATGLSKTACSARASRLRSDGVPLKEFRPGPKRRNLKVETLRRLVKELNAHRKQAEKKAEAPPFTLEELLLT